MHKLQAFQPTILIFDSGVGGLSVYREVRKLLPNLYYIYVFDNDAFPYGEKSIEFIIERTIRVFKKIQKKHVLSAAVLACNTASTVSLPFLREQFQFPIIGVVPAIKTAAKFTQNRVIGLLATKVTVNGYYTKNLINQFAVGCKIKAISSSQLVELAEQKLHGQIISIKALLPILKPWLVAKESPDTIVLGCTHFPLLLTELQKALLKKVRLIDSGAAVARRVAWLISNHQNLILTKSNNVSYCTKINMKVKKLFPLLINEGFHQLQKISI